MKPSTVRRAHGITTTVAIGATALALVLLCTAGCGQKGPLYLPDKTPTAVPADNAAAPAPPAQPAQPADADQDAKARQQRDAAGNSTAAPDGAH